MAAVAPAGLAELRASGDVYPTEILEGCETALILFAAGFHGRQDAVHIADAGLQATCVDIDGVRLGEMAAIYPPSWDFVDVDVFAYGRAALYTRRRWDVVSLDPPTNLFRKVADRDHTSLWARLARCVIVLGTALGASVTAPTGFRRLSPVRRSSAAEWAVFEADA